MELLFLKGYSDLNRAEFISIDGLLRKKMAKQKI